MLGAFAASLFYGDAIITPAISVLSAVEGLSVVTPRFEHWVVPIAIALLTALFMVQRRGTARIGRVFGPVMVLWFVVARDRSASSSIVQTPARARRGESRVTPFDFALERPGLALLALGRGVPVRDRRRGAVRRHGPFRQDARSASRGMRWCSRALMLNYFGQGALVLRDPEAAKNPFYLLAPEPLLLPLVVLATCATIIASQATISAAYSVTQQASRLNFLPRLRVLHTSDTAQGQIYVPLVNWLMLLGVRRRWCSVSARRARSRARTASRSTAT